MLLTRKIFSKTNLYQLVFVLSFFLACGCVVVCFYGRSISYFDNDTYWIIATGREIFKQKALPSTNPLTFHDNLTFVVHQWLYTVIVTFLYDHVGQWSLFALSSFLLFITSCLSYSLIRQFTSKKYVAFICSVLFLVANESFFCCRPQSFSIPIFLFSMICWVKAKNNKKWLIVVPLLSLLEVNIHTSLWLMLPVFSFPFVLPEKMPYHISFKQYVYDYAVDKKLYFLTYLLLWGFGLLNPYGLTGMFYPLISYGTVNNNTIKELKAPSFNTLEGIITIICIVSFSLFVYKWFLTSKQTKNVNTEKLNLNYCCLFLGCAVLAMMHIRNLWFLTIAAIPSFISLADNVSCNALKSAYNKETKIISVVCLIPFIFCCFFFCSQIITPKNKDLPVKIVDYLDEHHDKNTKIYTGFNNGGYLEFRGYKVYIDARPEIYSSCINKKADIYKEYVDVYTGKTDVETWVDKYQFTDMIVSENIIKTYMRTRTDYKKIMTEGSMDYFVKIPDSEQK